jgi:hypothetical protein
MDPDPDPGGPKTRGSGGSGSGFGSGSATLLLRLFIRANGMGAPTFIIFLLYTTTTIDKSGIH